MIRFAIVDTETTGLAPPAEVIELGLVRAVLTDEPAFEIQGPGWFWLFWPLLGNPPDSRAVHHLTNDELRGYPPFLEAVASGSAWAGGAPDVMAAHNCAFEQQWLTVHMTGEVRWICTMKAAMRVWPDAPSFSNMALFYWLQDDGVIPPVDLELISPTHRARPDAYVTAWLLKCLLDHATIDEMVAWTKEPKLMAKITFGQHRGKAWAEVPSDWLDWVTTKAKDLDEDTKWNAQREIDRRRETNR